MGPTRRTMFLCINLQNKFTNLVFISAVLVLLNNYGLSA